MKDKRLKYAYIQIKKTTAKAKFSSLLGEKVRWEGGGGSAYWFFNTFFVCLLHGWLLDYIGWGSNTILIIVSYTFLGLKLFYSFIWII